MGCCRLTWKSSNSGVEKEGRLRKGTSEEEVRFPDLPEGSRSQNHRNRARV